MEKILGIFGACVCLAFSVAQAGQGTWSSDEIPSHYEMDVPVNTTDPTVFIIGHGGRYYGFKITDERTRAWAEMIKTAVLEGKKIAIFYDSNDMVWNALCDGMNGSGVCNEQTGVWLRPVIRLALKYQ